MRALGVAENFDFEGFHNIIANIFHVVLVDTPIIPRHSPTQIEPEIFIEVYTLIHHDIIMSIIPRGICLRPSIEVFCGYPGQLSEGTKISCDLFHQLPTCHQNLSVFFKRISSEYALLVG